jgi:hypothetical protein
MDVDTRLLRYFAAVAAEGNLTRAAISFHQLWDERFVAAPAEMGNVRVLRRDRLGGLRGSSPPRRRITRRS